MTPVFNKIHDSPTCRSNTMHASDREQYKDVQLGIIDNEASAPDIKALALFRINVIDSYGEGGDEFYARARTLAIGAINDPGASAAVHSHALFLMAEMLYHGRGGEQDRDQAKDFFQYVIDNPSSNHFDRQESLFALALDCAGGKKTEANDYPKAFALVQAAIDDAVDDEDRHEIALKMMGYFRSREEATRSKEPMALGFVHRGYKGDRYGNLSSFR